MYKNISYNIYKIYCKDRKFCPLFYWEFPQPRDFHCNVNVRYILDLKVQTSVCCKLCLFFYCLNFA